MHSFLEELFTKVVNNLQCKFEYTSAIRTTFLRIFPTKTYQNQPLWQCLSYACGTCYFQCFLPSKQCDFNKNHKLSVFIGHQSSVILPERRLKYMFYSIFLGIIVLWFNRKTWNTVYFGHHSSLILLWRRLK